MSGLLRWIGLTTIVLGLAAGRTIWEELDLEPGHVQVASPAADPATGTPATSPEATPACAADVAPGRIVAVANEVTIHLTDQGFDPATIQATSGHDLTITLINTGSRSHAFVLDDFAIDVELPPGASETVTIRPGDRGDAVTYTFASDAPGDGCMRGTLVFYV